MLYTNYKPEISANDIGIWRRIIIINYSDYLFKNAGGAILKWIIEGAYKVIKKGFKHTPPEVVIKRLTTTKQITIGSQTS